MDRKGYFLGPMQTHQATMVWWMFKYVPPPFFCLGNHVLRNRKECLGWGWRKKERKRGN